MIGAAVLAPLCATLAGLASGLLWRVPSAARADSLLMQRVNRAALPEIADRSLAVVRIAGTTPFFIVLLVAIAITRPSWALGLGLAAVTAEGVARSLKSLTRRSRPFAIDPGVVLRLPRRPIDASFPSADAMRAAFLSGLTIAGELPGWAVGAAVLGAIVVAYGRVRAGAHYPLDVWAGLTLGLGAVLTWAGTL